jgi:DNA-binding transcriptional ArsR family regulator
MAFPDERGRRFRSRHGHDLRHDGEHLTGEGRGRHRRRHWRGNGGPRGDWRGGFPFDPFGPFGGGPFLGYGPKVGRGDVRTAVLRLLAEEPRNGYQIIQELTERSGGVWRPSPGSIYPTLQQLQDEGLISAEEKDGKRLYRLTEEGLSGASTLGDDVAAPWDTASDNVGQVAIDLRALIGQVASALFQVAHVGNDAQVAKAKEVMTNARRSLYRILAEDDGDGVAGS